MGTDFLNLEANERVDLQDLEYGLTTIPKQQENQLAGEILTDSTWANRTWILSGFNITAVGAGTVVEVNRGRGILAERDGATVRYGMFSTAGAATRSVDMAAYGNGTYGVYVRFEFLDSDSASRIFWNPAGNGSEYASTIATRKEANWNIRIEAGSPGSEWTEIASVVKQVGPPTLVVTDTRNFYFEGKVDDSYESTWSTDGGGGANDRNADRATYGVGDFRTFTAAMRQCLTDIRGRGLREWYEQGIGGINVGFDTNPTEGRLNIGDGDFGFLIVTGPPEIARCPMDRFDFHQYDRTNDAFEWFINSSNRLKLANTVLQPGTTNNLIDLGASGQKWKDLYVGSNIYFGSAGKIYESGNEFIFQGEANYYFAWDDLNNWWRFKHNTVDALILSAGTATFSTDLIANVSGAYGAIQNTLAGHGAGVFQLASYPDGKGSGTQTVATDELGEIAFLGNDEVNNALRTAKILATATGNLVQGSGGATKLGFYLDDGTENNFPSMRFEMSTGKIISGATSPANRASGYDLGDSSTFWKTIYSRGIYLETDSYIVNDASGDIKIIASGNDGVLFNSAEIKPVTNGAVYLGNGAARWGRVYSNDFLPYDDTTLTSAGGENIINVQNTVCCRGTITFDGSTPTAPSLAIGTDHWNMASISRTGIGVWEIVMDQAVDGDATVLVTTNDVPAVTCQFYAAVSGSTIYIFCTNITTGTATDATNTVGKLFVAVVGKG